MKLKIQLCLLLFVANVALGEDTLKPYSTENEWNSPSISASGGIGAYSDNFVDQYFSDPSMLALSKRNFILQFAGLSAYYSEGLKDTVTDVMTISSSQSSSTGNEQMISTLNKLNKVFGRRMSGGMNANFVSLKAGRITLIPYFVGTLKAVAHAPSYPSIVATADAYGGIGLGYAQSLGPRWDLGVNFRPGYRYYAAATVDASKVGGDLTGSSTSSNSDSTTSSYFQYGSGIYLPLDFAFGLNVGKQLRFNLVLRDFGGAPPFSSSDTKPPVYPMRINVGGAYAIVDVGVHKVILASEIQDFRNIMAYSGALYNRWQWAAMYKFRFASRTDTSIGVNTGLQSGYFSGGLFLDLFVAKLEAAWYAVEGAAYAGQDAEIRSAYKISTQLAF